MSMFEGMRFVSFGAPPPLVEPPSDLPDAKNLLMFDVDSKKNEIFEAARDRIKSKAQYTKSGRKPWTQITVTLPIKPATTEEEDLAVVWAVMSKSTNNEVKVKENGDVVWTMWGSHKYLKWLNIDPEKTKPINKFVHPAHYETGARKQTILETKLRKARKNGNAYEIESLERELEDYENAQEEKQQQAEAPSGMDYHWSYYSECVVTYKKKQSRKAAKELQLTVKVRTGYLGCGDPKDNNGYLGGGCSSS